MKEDTFAVIRKHPDGGFTYAYATIDNPQVSFEDIKSNHSYPRLEDAIVSATRNLPPRGLVIDRECFV